MSKDGYKKLVEERIALRRAAPRRVDPDDAKNWTLITAGIMALLITAAMIFMVLYKINSMIHVTPTF